jgi:hypothetical protein
MSANNKRIKQASTGQNRLSQEERIAMELWMKSNRVYENGKGRDMTNLRWINGAASKGLLTASGDPKQAKQIGAHEALAKFVNDRLNLHGTGKSWTAETAASKWKNMKTSFKRIVRKYAFPSSDEWTKEGKTKEELASEIEKLTTLRRNACQSYDVLWEELQDHPSIVPHGQCESADFEAADGDDDDYAEHDGDEGEGILSETEVRSPKSPASSAKAGPRKSPSKPKKNKGVAKKQLSLKKTSEAPRHRDITAAYIAMKAEWNRMWLRSMMLKQRQEVFFACVDRGYSDARIDQVMVAVGLGRLPAYMTSWGEDPMGNLDTQIPPQAEAGDHAAEMRASSASEKAGYTGYSNSDEEYDDDDA